MNRHWNKPHFPTSIETIKLLIALTMLFACLLLSSIAQGSINIDLSDEEKEHLAAKGRVTMCVDPDWMPYERINEQGKHVGIAADFMSEFQKGIPVPIELVQTKSWQESLEAAKSRQCDILALLNESPQRREFLNFTDPYLTDSVVIVARNGVFYLDGLESLSGRKLGIVEGYVYEEKIRKQYPEIIIISVKSVGDALRKVSDGKIYATLDALFIITSNIQELGLSNLKIAGQTGLDNAFRVGVRKDDPILLSVFDKMVKNLDDATRNAILRRWYTIKFQHVTDWRMVWQVTGIAIIILCLLGYNIRNKALKKLNLALNNMNRQLSHDNITRKEAEAQVHSLTQELIMAQEAERQRIAFELHDNVAQELSSSKIASETLFDGHDEVPAEIRERNKKLTDLLLRSLKTVRSLSYDLRPSDIEHGDFIKIIRHYCEDFSVAEGIAVNFSSIGMNTISFDYNHRINVFRLLQEALNNIKKHAEADHLEIKMLSSHPNIIIRIEDNGKGCEIESRKTEALHEKRMGIKNMEERARLLGGCITLKSSPGSGMKIMIEFPYEKGKQYDKKNTDH